MRQIPLFVATFQNSFSTQTKLNLGSYFSFQAFLEGLDHNRNQKWINRVEKLNPKKPDYNASWPQKRTISTLCHDQDKPLTNVFGMRDFQTYPRFYSGPIFQNSPTHS